MIAVSAGNLELSDHFSCCGNANSEQRQSCARLAASRVDRSNMSKELIIELCDVQ